MLEKGYLGIDMGGTGVKSAVYGRDGGLLGAGHVKFEPVLNNEGHVEIPIEDVYAATREATAEAVRSSGVQIRAFAISSQGETFVPLDEDGNSLHPAIVWYDSRALSQTKALSKAMLDINPASEAAVSLEVICSAPKILWLREHYPELMSRVRRYLLLPDYFAYRMTGRAVTDNSVASSSGFYVDDTPGYASEALAAAGIEAGQLAEIQLPGTPIGTIWPDIAEEWGLSPDTLMVTGTMDQFAGALGAGNCRPGVVSETTGTCLALVTLTDKLPNPMPSGLFGGRFPIRRHQFAMAYSKTAGLVLDWFNSRFFPQKSLQGLGEMAAACPIGSGGVTVLPHFNGMVSPDPNPDARGFICNLTLSSGPMDIYRAILESLAFSVRENLELMHTHGFKPETIRSMGGAAKSDFLLQMKADVIGLPVERPKVTEAATLGAAMLAAAGVGDFKSIEEASESLYRSGRVFVPDSKSHDLYEGPYRAYVSLREKAYR
ncbi:MAG: FGGY-family carbohydrate kinase [Armatimonadota bacterium]